MKSLKRMVFVACATLSMSGLAWAGDPKTADDVVATRIGTPPSADPKLIMKGLDRFLAPSGINVYGYVEGSYMYNFAQPDDGTNHSRTFDFEDSDPTLNQVDLNIERVAKLHGGKFDIGFHVEGIYGADARFTHSSGMNFYGSDDSFQGDPQNQGDIVQAYADFVFPVLNGVRLRVGKFVSMDGFETTNILNSGLSGMPGGGGNGMSAFYSRGILFYTSTETGALATFGVNKECSVDVGFSRGFDQTFKDNNGSLTFLGAFNFIGLDGTSMAHFSMRCGPELDDDGGTYTTLFSLFGAKRWGDFMLGAEGRLDVTPHATDGIGFEQYGLGGHASYDICKYATLNGRIEWYRPEFFLNGVRVANHVYSAALGVSLRPFANVPIAKDIIFRPEIRCDYADVAFYNDGIDHVQFTAGLDAYFMY